MLLQIVAGVFLVSGVAVACLVTNFSSRALTTGQFTVPGMTFTVEEGQVSKKEDKEETVLFER